MSYATTIIARANLLAYWQCGESTGTTLADTSGNSKDLTTTASPTLGVAGSGAGGTAVTFNGSSQYASRTESIIGDSPTAFSYECLIKSSATAGVVMSAGSSSSATPTLRFGCGGVTGYTTHPFLLFRDNAGNGAHITNPAAGAMNTNAWRHVAVCYETAACSIWIDAVRVYYAAPGTVMGTTTLDRFAIGCWLRSAASSYIAATIQHAAVYSRILTETEIRESCTNAGITPPSQGGSTIIVIDD